MAKRCCHELLLRGACFAPGPSCKSALQAGQQQQHLASLRIYSTAAASTSSSAAAAATQPGVSQQLGQLWQVYKQLSKARLSLLVVSTTAAGFVAGSGSDIRWQDLGWTCLGTMGAAAAANTLNQWREVHQDSLMKRTARRPLPLGRISRLHALAFAGVAGAAGVTILGSQTNALAASLGAANIALYAGVYTPLKMVHPINTWVGAIVGAIPPLIGWAAAQGQLDVGAGLWAGLLYFWQLPHFLSLAWLCRADYARGGFQMLSTVDPSGRRTGACMLRNSLYLLPIGPAAFALGVAGPTFAAGASIASGVLAASAAAFARTPSPTAARVVFRGSLVYLPVVMLLGLWDRVPQQATQEQDNELQVVPGDREAANDLTLDASDPDGALKRNHWVVPMAPFPFLPVPSHLTAAARH